MKGIRIKSKNATGDEAILQNKKETREAGFLKRQQLNAVYKVVYDDERPPFSLYIYSRSQYITPALMKPIFYDLMKANGAEEGRDFEIIEVEK